MRPCLASRTLGPALCYSVERSLVTKVVAAETQTNDDHELVNVTYTHTHTLLATLAHLDAPFNESASE